MSYHLLKIETPEQEDLLTTLNKTLNLSYRAFAAIGKYKSNYPQKNIILSFQCVLQWSFLTIKKLPKKKLKR